jgi:hypothetical protein
MQALVARLKCGDRDPFGVLQDKAAVETAIKEAEDKCATGTTGECAAAWDNVSREQ